MRGIPKHLDPIQASKELKSIFKRTWQDSILDVKVVPNYSDLLDLAKEYKTVKEQVTKSESRYDELVTNEFFTRAPTGEEQIQINKYARKCKT